MIVAERDVYQKLVDTVLDEWPVLKPGEQIINSVEWPPNSGRFTFTIERGKSEEEPNLEIDLGETA